MREEITSSGVLPVALLVVLVTLLLVALRSRGLLRRSAALLLVPTSVAWVLFNGPLEGPVLLTLTRSNGVTVADLLAVVGILVAVAVLWRRPR